MSTARTVWLAGLTTVVVVASCFVPGFELADDATSSSAGGVGGQGGEPVGGGGSAGSSATCSHATWPSPPTEPSPGPENVEFVVALRQVNFGEVDLTEGPRVGYDLDYRCTCQGQGTSCKEPAWATGDHCDGPDGRDNATAQLFGLLSSFAPELSSERNSESAEKGQWSLLLRLSQYNGLSNDDQVVAALYPSPGLDRDPCNGTTPVANWDGLDRFPIGAEALHGFAGVGGAGGSYALGGCGPGPNFDVDDARYVDANAYVTNDTLVASLPEVGLLLVTDDRITPLKITAGFATAQLVHDPGTDSWSLREGLLVGRWKLSDFLAMVSTIRSGGEYLCTTHPLYEAMKSALCKYPDISATLSGPTAPCDSLSLGMAFEADPAQLGTVHISSAQPSDCPPGTNPADDECG